MADNASRQDQRITQLEADVQQLKRAMRTLIDQVYTPADTTAAAPKEAPAEHHSMPVDLAAELTKRSLIYTEAELQHITKIIGQYRLSAKEILDTLNKIATANQHATIRNLPAYCNNTFKYEHADKQRTGAA